MRHFSASLQALAAGALFLTTGCSPSVYTSIQKSYPARIEGSTVLVYDMADSLPEPAEILGSVTVKDSGFSVNCNYAKVMQRANAVLPGCAYYEAAEYGSVVWDYWEVC